MLDNSSDVETARIAPEVTVVTARCSNTQCLYGIRFERIAGEWVGTWTFPIEETKAQKEGYDRNEIRGSFSFASDYPGCPHCSRKGIVRCECGKNACWDGESKRVRCPWCLSEGEIQGVIEKLESGGDR